jgi:crossover junction endodeoxyribonuclease RuvC
MIIFGVDPGTILTGFGIINFKGKQLAHLKSGIIKTNSSDELSVKLKQIYSVLNDEVNKYKPDVFCIETAFYGKNVQSAMKIGYVRGVAMLVASMNNILCVEYSPREIKKAVVGKGSASKEQVQYMIKNLLNLEIERIKFDETDALAVAVCHSIKASSFSVSKGNWSSFVKNNPDRIVE